MEISYPSVCCLLFYSYFISFLFCLNTHKNVMKKITMKHSSIYFFYIDDIYFCGTARLMHSTDFRRRNNTLPKRPTNALIEDYMKKTTKRKENNRFFFSLLYFPFNQPLRCEPCDVFHSIHFTSPQ